MQDARELSPGGLEDRTATLLDRAASCTVQAEKRRIQQEVTLLNLALADRIAAAYRGRGIDGEDLVQVGRVGLVKAVLGYRVDMGTTFAAYARPTIAGEIKRHFRDHGWAVRPPRRSQELRLQLNALEPALWQQLRRLPDRRELAEALDVREAELTSVLLAGSSYTCRSFDAPECLGGATRLVDSIADERDEYAAVDRTESLRPAVALLCARDQQILRMRYGGSCTQQEIGLALGISQMQVSRLLVGILSDLRQRLVEPEHAPQRAS